ncbi:MAG TPA: glycoside hydrolase family 3 N-terminal domain-containing protein [Acidisarcina sp.]|nr:glycoside hydrolase family 3 N-terminal domain-containing protein [Acidisarcina sp.]
MFKKPFAALIFALAMLAFLNPELVVAAPKKADARKTTAVSQGAAVAPPNAQLADPKLNQRVEKLLQQMTLEEKVGQLVQYSAGAATGPGTGRGGYEEGIARGQIGSLLNAVGADKTNAYQHIAVEKSRLHIPLIFGYDVIHGHRTTFPVPLALAASFDPHAAEIVARTSAVEARADGVQWVFSPMVDIARDARWGRITESAGEDPYLGSAIARAWIRGYQQGDLSNPQSVAACVKHFAAYGAAIAGRDYNAVDMSEVTLRQVYLEPYRAAVEAGAATLMSSFNSINGVPATANPFTLTQILRKEWKFDGFVVSDWGAVSELLNHDIAPNGAAAAQKALTAGVDMDMEGGLYGTHLVSLVRSGELKESVVDEAVRRILRVKFALGLFEHPYAEKSAPYVATPEKREITRKIAEETLVLLKNEPLQGTGRLLPLKPSAHAIALIGPMADAKGEMLGSWAGSGNPDDAITLRQALEQRLGSGKVLYAKGTELKSESTEGFEAAIAAAKQADLVLMALGEEANDTGEAASRMNLGLTGNQQQLLEAVAATGKPIVLVLFNGRPLALPWAAKNIPAILEAWYPGIEAGNAVANVLLGEVNPSGKLPASFPYSVGQEPLSYSQFPTGRPIVDPDGVADVSDRGKYGSRYIDGPNDPIYPFGWGLSYTQFSYSPLTLNNAQVPLAAINADRKPASGPIKVGVFVKNTGTVPGTEVVQLYIHNTSASLEQPVRELKGFERVTLAPGEQKHVEFTLGFEELAFYNANLERVVEPTKYRIVVGGSSKAIEHTEVEITK